VHAICSDQYLPAAHSIHGSLPRFNLNVPLMHVLHVPCASLLYPTRHRHSEIAVLCWNLVLELSVHNKHASAEDDPVAPEYLPMAHSRQPDDPTYGLYILIGHAAQPVTVSVNPALHVHSVTAVDPRKLLECWGQEVHLIDPIVPFQVSAPHIHPFPLGPVEPCTHTQSETTVLPEVVVVEFIGHALQL